ncbi:hypothetical protein OSB04_027752 [Centaurea solstitialis]|uniref:G-patch domain-containing protein n=1 Tax=Centaurea solstitialis TaxID=347529 RepID=A0AA38SSQ9_9ASTR|nr:hypothetical protein OSB04_027752 [Centaurea solstitialis]
MSNLEDSSTATPIASSNIGFQLLKKHGWKEGTGLGVSEQAKPNVEIERMALDEIKDLNWAFCLDRSELLVKSLVKWVSFEIVRLLSSSRFLPLAGCSFGVSSVSFVSFNLCTLMQKFQCEATNDCFLKQGRLEPVQAYQKKNKRGLGAAETKKSQSTGDRKNMASDKTGDKLSSRSKAKRSKKLKKALEMEKKLQEQEFQAAFFREFWPDNTDANGLDAQEIGRRDSNDLFRTASDGPEILDAHGQRFLILLMLYTPEPITYTRNKMDLQGHGQPQAGNMMSNVPQLPYATNPYDSTQISGAPGRGPVVTSGGPIQATAQPTAAQLAQQQLAYQQIQQQQQQQLQQQLQSFWANQYREIENVNDFKNHSLPLARIKKIMKADEDVRMISAEAPIVFARACEMFILELTLRSWNHTEENKRRTLQKNDIAAAITRTDIFDFLVDIVPREDIKDEAMTSMPTVTVPVGGPSDTFPYYYMPAQQSPQSGNPGDDAKQAYVGSCSLCTAGSHLYGSWNLATATSTASITLGFIDAQECNRIILEDAMPIGIRELKTTKPKSIMVSIYKRWKQDEAEGDNKQLFSIHSLCCIERRCGFIRWFDPPMCSRSMEIIPGLLNSKNQLDAKIKYLEHEARSFVVTFLVTFDTPNCLANPFQLVSFSDLCNTLLPLLLWTSNRRQFLKHRSQSGQVIIFVAFCLDGTHDVLHRRTQIQPEPVKPSGRALVVVGGGFFLFEQEVHEYVFVVKELQ